MDMNQNIHGRRWGRGLRPWLLIPKYLCVAMALGGVVAAGVLTQHLQSLPVEQRGDVCESIGRLFRWQIIPAVAAAGMLGVGLLLQHWRILLRMRWLQAKLALVFVGIPALHVGLSTALGDLRRRPASSAGGLAVGLGIAVALLVMVIILGRLKPRLGQGYRRRG